MIRSSVNRDSSFEFSPPGKLYSEVVLNFRGLRLPWPAPHTYDVQKRKRVRPPSRDRLPERAQTRLDRLGQPAAGWRPIPAEPSLKPAPRYFGSVVTQGSPSGVPR